VKRLAFLSELAEAPILIVVPDPGTEHGRQLVEALGATIDPELEPTPEALELVREVRATQ
jgi:hypothetical protein